MIKVIFFSLFGFINFSASAESKYMMPTLVLKDTLKKNKLAHCDSNLNLNLSFSTEEDGRRSSFQAEVDCEFKCKNRILQNERLANQHFDVHEMGLAKGDGGLWASTTTAIIYKAQETCLDLAASMCGSLEEVDQFKMKEMNSGEWSFDGKAGCGKNQPSIISPFDEKIKVNQSVRSSAKTSPVKERLRFGWDKQFEIQHFTSKSKEPLKQCNKFIEGVFCYGDCVTLDQEISHELLASPNPLGSEDVKICADEFLSSISMLTLSKNIKQHLCETFFLSEIKRQGIRGLSCASSRFDVRCPE